MRPVTIKQGLHPVTITPDLRPVTITPDLRPVMFKSKKMLKKRWRTVIIAFIVGCSLILGWGASYGLQGSIEAQTKAVDKATGNFKIGEDFYLQYCATCHIPIPPAVLPQQTWQRILENPGNHYGVRIEGLTGFTQRLMWQYLQNYSRQLLKNETEPKYIAQSRYFFALHPNVTLPTPTTLNTCIECHHQAQDFNYRIDFEQSLNEILSK